MFDVQSADDALRVARELCTRHAGIVDAGSDREARDIALRVVLAEVMSPGSTTEVGSPEAKRHFDREPSSQATPNPSRALNNTPSPKYLSPTGKAPSTLRSRKSSSARGEECFYCTEPGSRYCKETGRRHETVQQRASRQWRQLYRQMALASTFVSTARLAKVNTCVEEYAIDLNFDDI